VIFPNTAIKRPTSSSARSLVGATCS
jgi:hypothetical protein